MELALLRSKAAPVLLAALTVGLAACTSLGPERVGIDRSDYAQRLRDSEKEQLLSNIVALRYGDAPLFLNVTSVISQYTRESSGRLDVAINPPPDDAGGGASGSVLLRETPTVTYTPLSGERFSRHLLAPMSPASVLSMMEAGWASDMLLRLSARSINGVSNDSRAPLFEHQADPDFEDVLAALRRLQRTEALSIRVRQQDNVFVALARVRPHLNEVETRDLDYIRQRLNLKSQDGTLRIAFGSYPTAQDELAIATRSMFEVLVELSRCVDLTDAEATPMPACPASMMRIHSGSERPERSHVAVHYHDRWFWIDRDDTTSKQMFLLAQVLMSLTDTGSGQTAPMVTLPAG